MRIQLVGESTVGRGVYSWCGRVQLVGERTVGR